MIDLPSDPSQLPDSIRLEADVYRLDPARFPRRVDIELSAEAHEKLLQWAARCGRSPGDLAQHLISQSLDNGVDCLQD